MEIRFIMKIYIVIIEDRHCDVEVKPFADYSSAEAYARETCLRYHPTWKLHQLDMVMVKAGWVFYATYFEDDCSVRIVEREMTLL